MAAAFNSRFSCALLAYKVTGVFDLPLCLELKVFTQELLPLRDLVTLTAINQDVAHRF